MLRSRVIPCLLIHKKGLVKTVNFKNPKYVGDPINAVKIFNEKEVDELIVLDIDASVENREPNFEMIKNLAMEWDEALIHQLVVENPLMVAEMVEEFDLFPSELFTPSDDFFASSGIASINEQVKSMVWEAVHQQYSKQLDLKHCSLR